MTARAESNPFSERGMALVRTFRAAFHAVEEHKKAHPGEYAEIMASCASHVRSSAPMAMIDTGPAPRFDVSDMNADLDGWRELADGSRYRAFREADAVMLLLVDGHGDKTTSAMLPIEWVRMRADVDAIAATVKP